jgi:molybdate transport system substrate-binding protein
MRHLVATLLVLVVWAATPAAPRAAESAALRVAAAADLKFALDELVVKFQTAHKGERVEVSYGSSGNFFAQLSNRAPFDLFFSADVDYPKKLEAAGLGIEGSLFTYAVGRIVVWVPRSSPLEIEATGLKALVQARRIAIANPIHAPYGRAAEAALRFYGVYDDVKDRLALGENVAQAAQFVQTSAADAGIIALSLALAPAMQSEGRYWEVPREAYPRLEQGGIILQWAHDAQAARSFRDFVLGPGGRSTLERYGFSLPGN